uniref:GrpE protein homolog n=1 Tax=Heterosigma akashiwo TaxID=2829 RepID=A0A7S4DBK6_HETAK
MATSMSQLVRAGLRAGLKSRPQTRNLSSLALIRSGLSPISKSRSEVTLNVGRPFPNKRAVVGDFPVRQPLCGAQKLFFSTEDKTIKDDEKKAGQAEINVEGSAEETVATDNADTVKEEGEEEVNPLAEEVEKLKAEVEASKKKLLLAYAEMENVRAIARRDVDGAKTYAVQGFAKGLLDVADNLERALAAVPAAAAAARARRRAAGRRRRAGRACSAGGRRKPPPLRPRTSRVGWRAHGRFFGPPQRGGASARRGGRLGAR